MIRDAEPHHRREPVDLDGLVLTTGPSDAALVIADDGPGIPEGDLVGVKERFTRLDDASTRATCGVGLGLAIVDDVVAVHGAQLRVEDAAPGVRIVIAIPMAGSADPAAG